MSCGKSDLLDGYEEVPLWKYWLLPVWAWVIVAFTGVIYRQATQKYWGPEKYMPGAPLRTRYFLGKINLREKK